MISTAPSKKYFRVTPVRGVKASKVDRLNGIIRGAAVMQLGRVNDSRPQIVDETTLKQVVDLGNRPNKGIKCRFTHPNMSDDGMGKHLGRYRNYRIDGDTVRADLHFAKPALTRAYANYVMDFAEDDPGLFGNSVVVGIDEDAMEATQDKAGLQKVRIFELYATDVVDDPAATRGGFFSDIDSQADLPAIVTQVLDRHFQGADPEVIRARFEGLLAKYLESKGTPVMADQPKPVPPAPTPEPQTEPPQPQPTPKPNPNAFATVTMPDPAAIRAEAIASENKRINEIIAMGELAGLPDMAKKFAADLTCTIDAARAAMFDAKCRQETAAAVAPGSGDPEPADENAKFKAEYAADKDYFRKSGTTEADYITSRRITEGLEDLVQR